MRELTIVYGENREGISDERGKLLLRDRFLEPEGVPRILGHRAAFRDASTHLANGNRLPDDLADLPEEEGMPES